MNQKHPSIIVRNALKVKLEKLSVPFCEEHWVQMENIIIAQPKSVVIKTPTLFLQFFYLILILSTISCIIFYPQKNILKPLPIKYYGSLLTSNKAKNSNLKNAIHYYKAIIKADSLAITN